MSTTRLLSATILTVLLAGSAAPAGPSAIRAPLQPVAQRKAAPAFSLQDSSGKAIRLADYRYRK